MKGKICLVTGANAGIGRATAEGLAARGATVVMLCRDAERGQTAVREVQRATGNAQVELLLCDLSSQASMRQAAADFQARHAALHVLINNAGIIPQERAESADGWEMQLAVNHLAYFYLTHLLLDMLKRSAPARIINVASQVHAQGRIDFDDLQSRRDYRPSQVYANTKLMNVLFTFELARRLEGSGVTANCLHPGVVDTNLLRDYTGTPRAARSKSGISPEAGARTSLYLATAPEVARVTGQYFRAERPSPVAPAAHDEALARRLWQASEQMSGLA